MTAAIDAKETPSFFVQADRPAINPHRKSRPGDVSLTASKSRTAEARKK
jgi:hypothetical protein